MTYQELVAEITRLPQEERLGLLEVLTQSLREELAPPGGHGPSLHRVRGMLKPDGPLPTDEELSDAYTRHLIEKYT